MSRSAFLMVSGGMLPSKILKNWKDHRDKIKIPDPVAKDLISNKL